MRVAVVAACPFPFPQGSQVFAGQMAQRLADRGHEVHLLTYGQGRALRDRGYVHHRTPQLPGGAVRRSGPHAMKPLHDLLLFEGVLRLLRSRPFDLVHCHNYEAAVVGLAARAIVGTPVVYHSHNMMGDEFPTYFPNGALRGLARRFGGMLDRSVPKRADRVVALCQYTAEKLQRCGVAAERVAVIPPGLDDQGRSGAKAPARARLAVPENSFVVGYCGNLDGYQNLEVLGAALAHLRSTLPEAELRWLVITHESGRRLERMVNRYRLQSVCRVVSVRNFARARIAMEACDVLVSARRTGSGFPIKMLNYMALGKAIVSAGCGGKAITDDREGLVVADDHPAAMAEALRRLAQDPALGQRLGSAARRCFLSHYTWDAVLPAIEDVYCSLAAGKASFSAVGRM